ncbi:MAG: hypothetical protein ACM3TR_10960 [Caulobacteraceae bacterium]
MDKLTIANIARGALVEQFEVELEKVLDNIVDPNTDPKKVRKIQINMEFKPNEKRNMAEIKCQTKSNLVPANTVETAITIGKGTDGTIAAAELDSEIFGQLKLGDEGNIEEAGKIVQYIKK